MSATRGGGGDWKKRKKRGTVFVHEVQKLVPGKSVRRVEEGGEKGLFSFLLSSCPFRTRGERHSFSREGEEWPRVS